MNLWVQRLGYLKAEWRTFWKARELRRVFSRQLGLEDSVIWASLYRRDIGKTLWFLQKVCE